MNLYHLGRGGRVGRRGSQGPERQLSRHHSAAFQTTASGGEGGGARKKLKNGAWCGGGSTGVERRVKKELRKVQLYTVKFTLPEENVNCFLLNNEAMDISFRHSAQSLATYTMHSLLVHICTCKNSISIFQSACESQAEIHWTIHRPRGLAA